MSVKVRFAPSPTGEMHVGNVRVAVLNWLFAKSQGGSFMLRMDDTDEARSTEAFENGIYEDLKWLGLEWDEFARQSNRYDRYDAAVEKLKQDGRLYPCYETQEELELKRRVRLGQGKPPVYDRSALDLTDAEKTDLEAQGRKPHWRFRLLDEAVDWDDLGRGAVHFAPGHLSDPVLIREDGRPLYTLSSVVDDGELEVTHVIRGEDHVANTAVQVQLFEALGFNVPTFAHLPLMVGAEGKKLSKREGSLSVRELCEEGVEPIALVAYLARLGTAQAPDGADTLQTLADDFAIDAYGRAAPRYDARELASLNVKVLHNLPFENVREKLVAFGLDQADEAFWLAVRANLESLEDMLYWWQVAHGEIVPEIEADDRDFLKAAADLLPTDQWDSEVYGRWIEQVKAETGRKGKQLFMPLRKALTGRNRGPELADLLPLMGRGRAVARLTAA